MTAFEEMGVMPELARAVEEMEWTLPTDIQAEGIPAILGGGDVLMAAETGSGKTGAFCLPVLQIVWETMKDVQQGKVGGAAPVVKGFSDWRLNVYDRGEAIAIDPDGLLCQSRDAVKWSGTRATKGVTGKGKYYYEATVTDDGLCRVGWSTLKATLDLGTDRQGFGFGGTGKKSFAKSFDSYGEAFGLQDTIGCFLDLDQGEISFSRNGNNYGKAFDIPPELENATFFPAVVLKNAEMMFNFGASPFNFPPNNGFISVAAADTDNVIDSSQHGGAGASSSGTRRSKERQTNEPMCLIIEPSLELAKQTHVQIETFKAYLESPKVRSMLATGQTPMRENMAQLQSGVDILTGTPGRVAQLVEGGYVQLDQVRFFVLDEADGLIAQQNLSFIERMHAQIPQISPEGRRMQMIVCSATLHNFDVKKMANKLMKFPQWVDLKGQDCVPDTVHHVVVTVDPMADKRWMHAKQAIETDGIHYGDEIRPGSNAPETLSEAVKILKGNYVLQAIREHKMDQSLIFCRTKVDCDNMERWLKGVGRNEFSCVCLHGDRRPQERQQNLQSFKDKKAKFLICTDVAARGIDITGVPFVINVTLPDDKANYLHRIGRVGRASRMGLAISLVSSVKEKVWYHGCPDRGRNCRNSRLTSEGGCAIWYDEPKLLSEVEDHLGVTIQQVDTNIKVPLDEFDGKVVYGAKRRENQSTYKGHTDVLATAVAELAYLERTVQTSYLKLKTRNI